MITKTCFMVLFPLNGNRQDLKKFYAWIYQVAADFYLSA